MTHMMEQMTLPGLDEAVQGNAGSRRWPMVKWADVLSIRNGKSQKDVVNDNGLYPIYGSGGIMGYADDYLCEENTVVIGRKGSINNPIFVETKFWNVDTAFGVVANQTKLTPKFLYYFCLSYNFERLNTTVTIPSLTKSNLLTVEIPLPPLPEQQRIVARLDKAQQLIDQRKEQLKLMDALMQSLFYEMCGDPVKNEKGWEVKPLDSLMTIVRGGSPRPIENFLGGSYPWIKIGDATKGDSIYLHSTKESITKEGLTKTRLLPSGSLIFANCGVSLGFARIITFEGCIHDGWLAFSDISPEHLDKIFLLKTLNTITQYFRNIAPDGTQPNLNTGIMKEHLMILPPLPLQQTFADRVQQIEALKQSMTTSLRELEHNFNALMQEAFEG